MTEPVKNKPATLCWRCRNAVAGCSWSQDFVPVKGWNAEPTTIGANEGHGSNKNYRSYRVLSCPEFVPDRRCGECRKRNKCKKRDRLMDDAHNCPEWRKERGTENESTL